MPRRALDREEMVVSRDTAFIGVLVDDLVTAASTSHIGSFTSRSEFRLLLRRTTRSRRLSPLAERYGLLSDDERRLAERPASSRRKRYWIWRVATSISAATANPVLEESVPSPISESAARSRSWLDGRGVSLASA